MGGLVLALETATATTRVALCRGERVVCEHAAPADAPAAELLLPTIDVALRDAGAALDDVEAFAVSIGPGSFTGLRIGLATLKGLAFGSSRLAVGVPTLAALSLAAPEGEGPVVAMLDARRGEVYAATHGAEGIEDPRLPCSVYGPQALIEALPSRCRLVGEGAGVCGEAVREALGDGVAIHADVEPRAAHVGRLAVAQLARGRGENPSELVPSYLRRAQAEVVRTGRALE